MNASQIMDVSRSRIGLSERDAASFAGAIDGATDAKAAALSPP